MANSPSTVTTLTVEPAIDRIDFSRIGSHEAPQTDHIRRFIETKNPLETFKLWAGGRPFDSLEEATAALEQDIAAIDQLVTEQLNEILHEKSFQQLEARWRGLQHLVDQVEQTDDEGAQAIVRIFDCEWRELAKDLQFATEFDQSQLFRRVYDEEFGAPGGQPFGLLLGDFEIGATTAGPSGNDLSALRALADTAAAAFAPFVAQAHSALFGLDRIVDLQRQLDLRLRFESPEMRHWKDLRTAHESRFLGLTVPRVLIRKPYCDDGSQDHGFRFCEDVSAPDASAYCWASGIWALGGVAIRAYQECGWFADMRGVRRGERGGGLIEALPKLDYGTDSPGIAVRAPLEVAITDEIERELAEQGFICLCPNGQDGEAAFYTMPSLAKPQQYDTKEATSNSAISAMLPYLLCVSRFAHALKVMSRDQIGSPEEAASLQSRLRDWIRKFVVEGTMSSVEQRAKYPLSGANVTVDAVDQSGHYNCVLQLEPHLQFDQMVASVTLKTRLEKRR